MLTSKLIRRVLIVDDSLAVREGIKAILRPYPEWEVCGECVSGEEALISVQTLRPDVVLLDISLPGVNGTAIARKIRFGNADISIVIMSEQDPDVLKLMVRELGFATIAKSNLARELIQLLRHTA